MLKKLRIRFIFAAILSITLVLCGVVGVINVQNYQKIDRAADRTLDLLEEGGGKFPAPAEGGTDAPTPPDDSGGNGGTDPGGERPTPPDKRPGSGEMSPEAPYETRFYTVTLDSSGAEIAVDMTQIAAVDSATATSQAQALSAAGRTGGFVGDYKFRAVPMEDGSVLYLFLDCTRGLSTFRGFLQASILVSLLGLALVALLVVVFSGLLMRPFARMYEQQKQFITDANHELKTPLTVIGADCEILEYNIGENEWTQAIREQVARLTELTDKLVLLSRMDEGKRRYVMTDFSLSETVQDAVAPYRAVAETRGKTFTVQVEEGVSCHGDVTLIRQLLSLLLDNAFKYSDTPGDIRLVLTRAGKGARLTLSNTTAGVPKGDLACLFERFYRLDASRNSESGGHGVGLSVAKSIV